MHYWHNPEKFTESVTLLEMHSPYTLGDLPQSCDFRSCVIHRALSRRKTTDMVFPVEGIPVHPWPLIAISGFLTAALYQIFRVKPQLPPFCPGSILIWFKADLPSCPANPCLLMKNGKTIFFDRQVNIYVLTISVGSYRLTLCWFWWNRVIRSINSPSHCTIANTPIKFIHVSWISSVAVSI